MKHYFTEKGSEVIRIIGGRSNAFLVKSGSRNILVDSSVSFVRKKITKRLQLLCPSGIDLLILTHSHFDHSANVAFLQKLLEVKVLIHKDEAELLSGGLTASPAGTNFITRPMMRFLNKRRPVRLNYDPCSADILIDGDYSPFQDVDIRLLCTPGHSAGSICVIIDNEIAIAGDTVFGIFPGTAFPPFADDIAVLLESWRCLLNTNCKLFLPAHGIAVSHKLLAKSYVKTKNGNQSQS